MFVSGPLKEGIDSDDLENKYKKPRKRQSPYSIQNALWLIASAATIYYTDFAIAIFTDPKVIR